MLTCARRETHKQEKVEVLEDRLSDLPDELLTHILSFLSTKEAVRTGILSTRWKSIWAFAPTLDLSDKDFSIETDCRWDKINTRVRFLNFLDRKLSAPFLEKVVIRCDVIRPLYIEPRICAVIERKVRELHIIFGFRFCFRFLRSNALPESLFSCNTLVVLRVSASLILNFPVATTCFPSLKVLTLESIWYKDDNSASNLFSSCPILEDLVMVRRIYDNMKTLSVVSQSLKRLWVKFKSPLDNRSHYAQKMVIDAPALDYINLDDNVTKDYEVRDLSSLHQAHLRVTNYRSLVCKLLRGISNVKFLSLSRCTMSLAAVDSYKLPIFHNLTCLKLVSHKDWKWKLVLEFLKICPILEVLKFEGFSFSYEQTGKSWWEWDVPNCLRSHLKTIEITRFIPKNGAEVLQYFVANAEVLEEKIIDEQLKLLKAIPD